jgi:hypothetical protein
MRLTLRTLLAYLEDALPSESTKKIGRMLARSSSARRLVRRIRKVVRRRRLIAVKPDSDSRRGMDANDMAEYLDNVLPEDQVLRVERRCLKHDALLAEAAASHQILSRVLGEVSPVGEEARRKAYAAVGVFAVTPTNIAVVGSTPTTLAPTTESAKGKSTIDDHAPELPIPTFAPPESTAGRVALVALVAMLFIALGVVLWRGLEPGPTLADAKNPDQKDAAVEKQVAVKDAAASLPKELPAEVKNKEIAVVVDQNKTPQLVVASTPSPRVVGNVPESTAKPAPKEETKRLPPPPLPQPARTEAAPAAPVIVKAADYISPTGVLCRLRPEGPERLQTSAAVMVGDTIVNLDGARSLLSVGKHAFDMVDGSKLRIRPGPQPVFELLRGRFVFRSVDQATVFRLGIGPDDVLVHIPKPNSLLTLEYLPATSGGDTATPAAILIGAISNDVTIEHLGRKSDLQRGSVVDVVQGRGIGTTHAEQTPVWLTGTQLTRLELKAADRLAERNAIPFGTQGVVAALQARVVDRDPYVRKLAIGALAAVEVYSAVVDALSDTRYHDNRASAHAALRPVVQHDPGGTEAIRRALLHSIPAEEADTVIKLIDGYTPQEFMDARVGKRLVECLESELLPIRELAIQNLRVLTGKDFGYSPTEPAARRASGVKQAESFIRERR